MPRPMWTGAISFGLINIPVQLYNAITDSRVHFHMLSPDGKHRLKRKLFDPETDKEYEFNETTKCFEIAPGQYVVIDPEEIEKLHPESGRTIDIEQFVDLPEIDPIYYNRTYYLAPQKEGTKAYQLLVETLRDTHKVGIAKFVMRENEYLAALRIKDDVLILETMYFADEIKDVEELPIPKRAPKITDKEVKLAAQLVESLTDSFNPRKYKNEYVEKVKALIKDKRKGKKVKVSEPKAVEKTTNVIDLMEVLQRSVNNKKSAKASNSKGRAKETTPKKRAGGRR